MMIGLPNTSDEYQYLLQHIWVLCDLKYGWYGHIPCKLESRFHQERSAQSLTDYDPFSLRDLLRMVRNVFQHHDDNYKVIFFLLSYNFFSMKLQGLK
jgi:hypothetical protein